MGRRDYQDNALEALWADLCNGEHPVASMPTGSGKSHVVGGLAERAVEHGYKRIVITVPSRELAEQNERAARLVLPKATLGVCCAALKRNEVNRQVVIGTPQSLAQRIPYGPIDLVIVDEAHQMPLHKGSWFDRLFAAMKGGRSIPRAGCSATTFRVADGAIFGKSATKAWFTTQPYEITTADLIAQGWLAPVRAVEPAILMTTKGVKTSAGDYNQADLVAANVDQVSGQVALIKDEIAAGRKRVMLFAVTIEHIEEYLRAFAGSVEAVPIHSKLTTEERRRNVERFRAGQATVAVTVQAALTGFDVPEIDLVASCRPTKSAIIHTQSIGRGTRPAEKKVDCLNLDFAGNVPVFGPVDDPHFDRSGQPKGGVAPWRACPACGTYNHFETSRCLHCDEPLVTRRQLTPEELANAKINWLEEKRAIDRLVAMRGMRGLRVESIAVHPYLSKHSGRQTAMLSFNLGNGAIVRHWFNLRRDPNSQDWQRRWEVLGGTAPAPKSIEEAVMRAGELVRPAEVSIRERQAGETKRMWDVRGVRYFDAEEEELDETEHAPIV